MKYKLISIISIIIIALSLSWLGVIGYRYFNPSYEKTIEVDDKTIGYNYYEINKSYKFLMPSDMDVMSDQEIKKKYNDDNRPNLSYSNGNDVNILIVNKGQDITDNDILEFVNSYYGILINTECITAKMTKIGDKKVGRIETITFNDTDRYYNSMIAFALDGQYTIFSINCKEEDREMYQNYIDEIINSFEFTI